MLKLLFFANICFLVGLIWTIQLVHYPSFAKVNPDRFLDFHSFHTRSISLIVIPLMLSELILSLWILGQDQSLLSLVMFALLLIIWGSTAFLSVPLHNQLSLGYSEKAISALVATNWIRTIAWTVRGIIAFIWIQK